MKRRRNEGDPGRLEKLAAQAQDYARHKALKQLELRGMRIENRGFDPSLN